MIARLPGRSTGPIAVVATLLLVYGFTLARDVTFWDAGEFIAAASDFGIPHPPGTPLYVMLLRVALLLLVPLGVPPAVATSLVSAAATAGACGLGAALLQRATGDRWASIAGGIAAGAMTSVWLNASETEVYAASLALSLVIMWTADRAGRRRSLPWTILTAYLIVLAVPLHLSALLVAPAALYFLADNGWSGRRESVVRVGIGLFALAAAFGIGTMRPYSAVVALIALAGIGMRARMPGAGTIARPLVLPVVVAALAASALLVLIVRAQHDPVINQGNPATWPALVDAVARRQYAVADLWPRQAPLWLQLANLAHWADWQVALSLGPTIFPTPARTASTLVFVALAIYGARAHWRADRRSATAFALLLAAGTIGAALYLNLRAGPSFGHGVLPDGALREARERDYFFVLGWWAWGAWAGVGAVAVMRRFALPGWLGLAGAAVPLVLNWTAVDRTRLPEAALPRLTAEGLLGYAPRDAVLFVAGDNDSYPLWYAQRTLGLRRDVTVITTPLLPADWYREELARRHGLFVTGRVPPWEGRAAAIREIAARARAVGRPVAMAVSMPAGDRALVAEDWILAGPVFVPAAGGSSVAGAVLVDTSAADAWQQRLARAGRRARPATDGTALYMSTLLQCPGTVIAQQRSGADPATIDSLAPRCNLR